jgi:hypothetical protein
VPAKATVDLGLRAVHAAAAAAHAAATAASASDAPQHMPSKHADTLAQRTATFFTAGRTDGALSSLGAAINVLNPARGGRIPAGSPHWTQLAVMYAARSLLRVHLACAPRVASRDRAAELKMARLEAQRAMNMVPAHPLPTYAMAHVQLAASVGTDGARFDIVCGVAIQTLRRFVSADKQRQMSGACRAVRLAVHGGHFYI